MNRTLQVFDITCDPLKNTESQQTCRCESLESISAHIKDLTNLCINLKTRELELNTPVHFTNLSFLNITGEPGLTTITCKVSDSSSRGTGIVLSEIVEITLKNLHLISCGSFYLNKFRSNKTFSAAITIFHSQNVEMNSMAITQSKGLGLMILNHQGGKVNIKSSQFKENELPQEYIAKSVYGGGGVYILLGQFLETAYLPMTFHFDNCTFESNKGHTRHYQFHYTSVVGKATNGYGRGGGVHLSIKQGLSNVSVSFSDCLFISNQAFFGGGLSVKTYIGMTDQIMTNIIVEVKNSLFQENGCTNTHLAYYGGGACFAFTTYKHGSAITNSHYFVHNVSFINNCAKLGGGVIYLSDRHSARSMSTSMDFENSTFKSNSAYIGSAAFISPNVFSKLSLGLAIPPTFTNCHFMENIVSNNPLQSQYDIQTTMGIATIYASVYDIYFQGCNHFESNWGTAVYIVNGVVNFQNSSAHFINNTGTQGGALVLIGSSVMIVGPKNYSFINNRALYEGGALYVLLVDSTDFVTSRSCFIQYANNESTVLSTIWNSNITFVGNTAKNYTAGHAIYATSVHPCQVVSNSTINYKYHDILVNPSEVFTIRGIKFDNDPLRQPQIATDGALLHSSKSTQLTVIPGQKYDHGVTITDDLGHQVETLLTTSINRNAKNVHLDSLFIGDKLQLRGKPKEDASLYLQTISLRKSYVELNVTLLCCPPGFTLNDNLECVCRAHAHWGLIKCDLDTFRSQLIYGFWAGLLTSLNGSELVTSASPFFDYGNSISNDSEFEVVLPQTYSELSRTVCGETRTGTVCGRCRENYTVHFHSPGFLCKPAGKPVDCKLGWLFFILSDLVPVTVVFITVLVLNISFTSGSVNGFILFSQLLDTMDIDTSGIISFPDSVKERINGWTRGYQVVYGFINLDYFSFESISFCLWKDASALDMLAVKYITVLYTLLMIIVVIWIMNKCAGRCCGKYCRITTIKTSMIHGISTFLVICYTQCIKVSLSLITPVQLHSEESSVFRPSSRVWLNGEITYFSKNHLAYAFPALFCLCTIGILPPALLLSYPLLNKVMAFFGCENLKLLDLITRKLTFGGLMPLLDCFQGCFKDSCRFFSGLYFLYRWVFLCFYMSKGFSIYFTGVAGFLVFVIILHSIWQPYIKRSHNVIDTLLFADLLLIDLLSFYNYHKSHDHRELEKVIAPAILQLILIYLPLIVMGVCLLFRMCKKPGNNPLFTYASTMVSERRKNKLKELAKAISILEENNDSNEVEFVHLRQMDESENLSNVYFRVEGDSENVPFDTYP